MAVKRSRSGARILTVLEAVAQDQPVGVSELARALGDDKSTVQRMLMTLADAGWIRVAAGPSTRWEVTGRVETLAHYARDRSDLRQRARAVLESLRERSGETTALTVPDLDRFMVAEVVESREILRMAPRVGQIVPGKINASALAWLSFVPHERRSAFLGYEPDAALLADFEQVERQGYAVRWGDRAGGSVNIAAPVFDRQDEPVASIVVTAPAGRLPPERYAYVAAMVCEAARSLSNRDPRADVRRLAARG
jgi:IclR family acetate operon transcriptional repressor